MRGRGRSLRLIKNGVIFCLGLYLVHSPARAAEFSLKVHGGWVWVEGGDLNRSIAAWQDYYQDLKSSSFSFSDQLQKMHGGSDTGAELTIRLTNRWSIGVGAGYWAGRTRGEIKTQLSERADYSLSPSRWGTITREEATTQTIRYELRTIPVTLTAYYRLLSREKVRLYLGGGTGIYFSRYSSNEPYRYTFNLTDEQSTAGSSVQYVDRYETAGVYAEKAMSPGFGLHALTGLDIRLTTSLSVFVEVVGRWADNKGWRGEKSDSYDWTHSWGLWGGYSDQGTENEAYDGQLWRVDAASDLTGKTYPRLVFSGEKPVSSDYRAVRPANLGLSGFSAKIGLHIRFGNKL